MEIVTKQTSPRTLRLQCWVGWLTSMQRRPTTNPSNWKIYLCTRPSGLFIVERPPGAKRREDNMSIMLLKYRPAGITWNDYFRTSKKVYAEIWLATSRRTRVCQLWLSCKKEYIREGTGPWYLFYRLAWASSGIFSSENLNWIFIQVEWFHCQ